MFEYIKSIFTTSGRSMIDQLAALKKENSELIGQVAEHKKKIESLQDYVNSMMSTETCDFAIDWDNMSVFSIERMNSQTVVGYWKNETNSLVDDNGHIAVQGVPTSVRICGEWYLQCSIAKHNELVAEFKQWKSSRSHDTVVSSPISLDKV